MCAGINGSLFLPVSVERFAEYVIDTRNLYFGCKTINSHGWGKREAIGSWHIRIVSFH